MKRAFSFFVIVNVISILFFAYRLLEQEKEMKRVQDQIDILFWNMNILKGGHPLDPPLQFRTQEG